jgi:ceramide glucosyltransferase
MFNSWTMLIGQVLSGAAAAYALASITAVFAATRRRAQSDPLPSKQSPPVTILKPLCGAEAETYECLRSFCVQDYPRYQVIFGVSDPNDPVIALVHRLQGEFPRQHIALTLDRTLHGTSRKVSNLINMMPLVQHDFLVLSDSDVRVTRDYLSHIVAPLRHPGVGIVTCAYRGIGARNFWSALGAMYINEWFVPSVRVAAMGGSSAFAFGATIGIRRDVLEEIGGFEAISNQLADDYRLGELTRRIGLKTVLSQIDVDTYVTKRSLPDLVHHELRWLRTIRAVRPFGYSFSFVTIGLPVAAIGALLCGGSPLSLAAIGLTLVCRVFVHLATRRAPQGPWAFAMILMRDVLTFALWCWSFSSRRVQWREEAFQIQDDGTAQLILGARP